MGSRPAREHYCRCGTHLARDNTSRQCSRCERASRDKLLAPPLVPAEFWHTEQFRTAFAARHIGRVFRAYRTHPHHSTRYGPAGISQTLLGQWLGMQQPQLSRVETGPPIRDIGTLTHWARVLRVPAELLWFRLPEETGEPVPARADTHPHDAERDPVLSAPWNHRGTVEAVVVLSGGDRLKRRVFLSLTGPALTAPAHQWLVHEPERVTSGLAGRRISAGVVDRISALITELRTMDDAAGGDHVLELAQSHFGWVAGLLDRARYDEATGRRLHSTLAELGQLCGWTAFDAENVGLAQRYNIAALRAAHAANDRPLGAHILGEMAYQAAHHGRAAEAATLTDTATVGLRGQESSRLQAQLWIQRAHAFATLHDISACKAAVSQARTHAEQTPQENEPAYLYWIRPAEVVSSAGECLLQLGQCDQAAKLLAEGIALFDASFDRDRQYYLTYLAEALARPGRQRDLEAAAGKGIEAIRLAGKVSSTTNTGRIRALSRVMKPHAKVSKVQDFLDRASELLESTPH